ncbi:MAG: hypothetical protein KBF33_14870 [Comamonas sp.]|nr:hypothetical protein [Comamonas sp.]
MRQHQGPQGPSFVGAACNGYATALPRTPRPLRDQALTTPGATRWTYYASTAAARRESTAPG